jgi:hypothetical protein
MPNRTLIAVAALTLTCFAFAKAQAGDNNSNAGGSNERNGTMQLVKSCNTYAGVPGNFCWISQSDLREIPVNTTGTADGSANYYTQPFPISPTNTTMQGLIDSNVILDAGDGNRAIGRCTFDVTTNTGVCNYTDGTGTLAGFSARLEVTLDDPNIPSYFLTGPYVFKNLKKPAG